MNKLKIFIFIVLCFAVSYCTNNPSTADEYEENQQSTDLEDLLIKYETFDIKNCEELFDTGNEICEIYLKTVAKAINGDSRAKSDLIDFDLFNKQFFLYANFAANKCQQDFDVWKAEFESKIVDAQRQLLENDKKNLENIIKLEDSILNDLLRQLEEMEKDITELSINKNVDVDIEHVEP